MVALLSGSPKGPSGVSLCKSMPPIIRSFLRTCVSEIELFQESMAISRTNPYVSLLVRTVLTGNHAHCVAPAGIGYVV